MNKNDLYKSLGEVDDDLLIRTETKHKNKQMSPFIHILAASLAFVIGVAGLYFLFNSSNPSNRSSSWFVITAYADNGEMTELEINDGYFNSGGTGESIFNTDVPLFDFSLNPAKWQGNQDTYSHFKVAVSYNGKAAGVKDEHITVVHSIPRPGSNEPYTYQILGWFEEPTDIVISITNKTSGIIVEEIIVNVCYTPELEAYKLTVTKIDTTLE